MYNIEPMHNFDEIVQFRDNDYYIQKLNIREFAEKTATPFYLYDLAVVLHHYRSLHRYIKWNKLRIYYAMKANYNADVLRAIKDEGGYLDTVSPAEIIYALKLGFTPERILFTANNMTDEEMHLVEKTGVLFNIDSISRLEKYGAEYPGSEVCLRFNPDVVAGENEKVQTAGELAKFGLLLDDLAEVKKVISKYSLKVIGLHEHTGSGISETGKVYQAMKNLLEIATPENFPDLKFIDFGGGFKVTYHPREVAIDYDEFGRKITDIFSDFCRNYGRELWMYFEPGKYIVAKSGCFAVRVNTIKNNRGRFIVGTDSGFPHLIRPVFYGAYHHILNISNPGGEPGLYDIYGNTCETGDCFAADRFMPQIREGDYLLILNAGAYCYSMASIYNLRALPAEYVIGEGKVKLSRKRQSNEALAQMLLEEYSE